PQSDDEAAVESSLLLYLGLGVGDTLTLESGKKTDMRNYLRNTRFTVSGVVESPYYISTERGSASIGDGQVDCYMLIPSGNFRQNVYSEAFVTVAGAMALPSFEDAYDELVAPVVDGLEALGEVRSSERFMELTSGARKILDEQEREARNALAEAADAYSGAEGELAEAEQSIRSSSGELAAKQGEILGGRAGVAEAEAQLGAATAALDAAERRVGIEASALEDTLAELRAALPELDLASASLLSQEAQLLAAGAGSLGASGSGASASDSAGYGAGAADGAGASGGSSASGASASGSSVSGSGASASDALAQIAAARLDIAQKRREAMESIELAEDGVRALEASAAELRLQRGRLAATRATLTAEKESLRNAESDVISAYIQAYSSLDELDRQRGSATGDQEDATGLLYAALERIESARAALDDLDEPSWYVWDRDGNPGYSGYFEDSDKVEAIGRVFPLIFFIVAALVCLTTMTRLVEERRTEIGALKAMGYGNSKIMSKYLIYAVIPTISGGLLGGLVGMSLFPVAIISAYGMYYALPEPLTPLSGGFWLMGILFAAFSTLFATVLAGANELRASPSTLMRPKPPKVGRGILLERVAPLWRSLSFIQKVTVRNIVRYKKRFFMTVAGISGCTALLVTGFGLRDSIDGMLVKQFEQINLYDMSISFTDTSKAQDLASVEDLCAKSGVARGVAKVRHKTVDAGSDSRDRADIPVNFIVPESPDAFPSYVQLRDRQSQQGIQLEDEGAVLSEKLARLLGVSAGDTFYIADDSNRRIGVPITAITETYAQHYVYMSPGAYASIYGKEPEYNLIYVLFGELSTDEFQSLVGEVLDRKYVAAVLLSSSIMSVFRDIVSNLNFIVLILILSAAALALVVLLNLTNINIGERIRELATIEVLGFFDGEVSAYVYRENAALTAVGAGAGIVLGIALHFYIIMTAETDIMMFSREVRPASYLYAIALTAFFSAAVNMLTSVKLRRINMVEALKSAE
ncbi:MAG: FtsX-like permease family protein, partial [Clostridiales bacterium]|nr:FtsX-like permease family protein [Clostridiales bacterium]